MMFESEGEASERACRREWGMSGEVLMADSSGHMFYGEGSIEAAMRTSERHEMSEKVNVCEMGMPYAESGKSNFEVMGGLIR